MARASLKNIDAVGGYEQSLAAFRKYDQNRDGRLSFQEMHNLMSALNPHGWTQKHTDALFSQIDKDHGGAIEIREFLAYLFPHKSGMTDYERVMSEFRNGDANLNGRIDKHEFRNVMQRLHMNVPPGQLDALFAHCDKDNSGEVDSSEFVAYLFGVPEDCAKQARRDQRRQSREDRGVPQTSHQVGAMVVIEIVYGPNVEQIAAAMAQMWRREHGTAIDVKLVCDNRFTSIDQVTAREGKVQFWHRGSMIAFREDPFRNDRSTRKFAEDVMRRDIPRLLSGAGMG